MNNTTRVAIYLRLSREDEAKFNESASITNQRSYITDYAENLGFKVLKEYIDDGFSGTNFDRPAFKQMIDDINDGIINTVITKDMSRLGRDYIEAGYYIEKFFPENNVRYIAINDNIDTFLDSSGNEMLPFKSVINDMYAKDISKKVKSSLTIKKKQGLFVGTHAPYGYKKDPENKYHLVIDPEASKVVKMMFDLFLEGKGLTAIARILTDKKIERPSVHKKMNIDYPLHTISLWSPTTIHDILINRVYCGDMVQGRRKKVNYKSKKVVYTDEQDWIIVENTHEPIIDRKLHDTVLAIYRKNRQKWETSNPRNILLQGLLFCKECKYTLGICSSANPERNYTICNHYRRIGKKSSCTTHCMRYETIENAVLKEVRNLCDKYLDTSDFENIIKDSVKKNTKLKELNQSLTEVRSNILLLERNIEDMYADKLNGTITKQIFEKFLTKKNNELEICKNEEIRLQTEITSYKEEKINLDTDYSAIIKEYISFEKPQKNLLASIIDRVEVDKDKNIDIYYRIKPLGN